MMKVISIVLFILTASFITIHAQDLENFENGFSGEHGTNGNASVGSFIFGITDNPLKSGINTTNKVAIMKKYQSGNWAYGWFDISPTSITVTAEEKKYFHIMVLEENILSGEDDQQGVFEWKDYVFEIPCSKVVSHIEISHDALLGSIDNNSYLYIDEIIVNSDSLPRTKQDVSIPGLKKNYRIYVCSPAILHIPDLEDEMLLEVFDLSDKLIYCRIAERENNLNHLSKGVYIARLSGSGRESCMKKIVLR